MQRLGERLHRSYKGKFFGRWEIGKITNDLKDTMYLTVPRSESQRMQETSPWQRWRRGAEERLGPRWARRGKGCPVWIHHTEVACAESRRDSGWGEGATFPWVLRKPQFQICFPPASNVTLAVVRRCVPISVSRNKQRSTEVLELRCSLNPVRHSVRLRGHTSNLQVSPSCTGWLATSPGVFAWFLSGKRPISAEDSKWICLSRKEPVAIFWNWPLLVEWGTAFKHPFSHSFTHSIDTCIFS